jgi:hypothetical protein
LHHEAVADLVVEGVDVDVLAGEDHRLPHFTGRCCVGGGCEVVHGDLGVQLFTAVALGHPAVLDVAGEGGGVMAGSEPLEGGDFPGLLLPLVADQDGGLLLGLAQVAEHATGVDLGQLRGVTDEQDPTPSAIHVLEQPGHLTGPDHPGLVDYHERSGGEALLRVGL